MLSREFARAAAELASSSSSGRWCLREEVISELREAATNLFCETGRELLNKWCINLFGLVVLEIGGQCAQVICQLQLQALGRVEAAGGRREGGGDAMRARGGRLGIITEHLPEVARFAQRHGYFFLCTVLEKRRMSVKMPFVAAPSSLFSYYYFQIKVVRPYIIEKELVLEEGHHERTLLVHSLRGSALSEREVSST